MHKTHTNNPGRTGPPTVDPRRRGSVYILVLGASLLVAAIGVSSLMAVRVQRREARVAAESAQAQELARTAIDRGLWEAKNNPLTWRTFFAAGTLTNVPLGNGTFTLLAVDPVDGNLINNNSDPVQLIGVGKVGVARYMLGVTLNGDGTVQPGTWKRVVN